MTILSGTGKIWPWKSQKDLALLQIRGWKWPLNGTLGCNQSRESFQRSLLFSPSWPLIRIQIWGTQATCSSVAILSPHPSLSPPPSDFLDDPYLTFPIHIWSLLLDTKKGFWGSLWSRTFSHNQKPEGSKTSHPTPVLSPGKSHEWRSLVGCSPWGS